MARTETVRVLPWRAACTLAIAVLAMPCLPARPAQQEKNSAADSSERHLKPLPKGGPTPRTPDGHPDFSGVWFPGVTGGYDTSNATALRTFDPKATPEEKPPFQPWAAAKVNSMTDVDKELGRASVNCMPRGTPLNFLGNPYPIKIVQTRDEMIQLFELNTNFRVVHLDARPHTKNPDATFAGDASTHWEGDTLVIDVIAIDERTWNNFLGWFHSDQEHVVERLTRPSENYLTYQVTIEDPKVLTRPWTSAPRTWTLGHEDLEEYYCTNNQEVHEYESLKDGQGKESGNTK
jgi:hypothetical protein